MDMAVLNQHNELLKHNLAVHLCRASLRDLNIHTVVCNLS